ncbi:hypothetical protein CLOSTMETH_01936 [[Clostridium] methylpentosum DSM 5476]|uniref:Uncharacterized protein n=1 Tax=[Clostridium] methylpentosum DSM 5476 TaxID=537013 RepID=C0EDK8_9FIRM|nr:hypothetical protein CLOSTMETH_01936 [[Clostridium] methylpentosum DSM 5476]
MNLWYIGLSIRSDFLYFISIRFQVAATEGNRTFYRDRPARYEPRHPSSC